VRSLSADRGLGAEWSARGRASQGEHTAQTDDSANRAALHKAIAPFQAYRLDPEIQGGVGEERALP
jgi:hypothetical protein